MTIVFNAEIKEKTGKGVARGLRRNHRIPAIIYGDKKEIMLSLIAKDFFKEYSKGNILSKIVKLDFGDQKIAAITRNVQINPVTDFPEHVDFQKVDQNTEIKVAVYVKILNDDKCPGIKKGGVMNVAQRSINFYCHPTNIPVYIEIDVAGLQIGQNIHINDVTLPIGIRPVIRDNFVILSIAGRAEEKETASTAEATTESK